MSTTTDAAQSQPPRDPSFYSPTIHAGQQAKDRGIEWGRVASVIEGGEVRETHKPDCVLFVGETVRVVADETNGDIVTVTYR